MKHSPSLLTNGYKSSINCLFYVKRIVHYRVHNSLALNSTIKYTKQGYPILPSNSCKICLKVLELRDKCRYLLHNVRNGRVFMVPRLFPFILVRSISMEHWRKSRNRGSWKYWENNPSQCHFVYSKSNADSPGIEKHLPRWQVGNKTNVHCIWVFVSPFTKNTVRLL